MEIKTTHEIANEHYSSYHPTNKKCNVEWVRVKEIIKVIEEYMYDGQSIECMDLCFSLLKQINGYYGSEKPKEFSKSRILPSLLNKLSEDKIGTAIYPSKSSQSFYCNKCVRCGKELDLRYCKNCLEIMNIKVEED
jgi:hypothetical protein